MIIFVFTCIGFLKTFVIKMLLFTNSQLNIDFFLKKPYMFNFYDTLKKFWKNKLLKENWWLIIANLL